MSDNSRVRIRSDQDIVTDAAVEVLDSDGEWRDVRTACSCATFKLKVGDVSRVELDLYLAECDIDVAELTVSAEQLEHTADVLRACGYTVEAPAAAEALSPADSELEEEA